VVNKDQRVGSTANSKEKCEEEEMHLSTMPAHWEGFWLYRSSTMLGELADGTFLLISHPIALIGYRA